MVNKHAIVSASAVVCTFLTGAVLVGCSSDDPNSPSASGGSVSASGGSAGTSNGAGGLAGETAADGKDGIDGTNGKDGKDGADGKDGTNGTNGTDGKDGTNGKDGTSPGPVALFITTPKSVTSATRATLAFGCSLGDCSYQCSLDNAAYATCTSPVTLNNLGIGSHDFAVKASVNGGAAGAVTNADWKVRQPNILYVMADDLGYSDIHALGGEIDTPNLDQLISNGRILTNHHAGTVSAITRSMLISGTDHHLVGEGTMGAPNDERKGLPGYEGYLNDRALSVAQLLQDGGYHTYIAGKWHIGSGIPGAAAGSGQTPDQWGFERSYVLLGGAASNHFAHEPAGSKNYAEDGKYVQPGQPGQPGGGTGSTPAVFYSTDFYTQQIINYIDSNKGDGKPFFAYAAYTSPHWPLQVPEPWLSKYRGRYDAGYDAIRAARIERLQNLGIIPYSWTPHPAVPETLTASPATPGTATPATAKYLSAVHDATDGYVDYRQGFVNKSWSSLTALEKKAQARYMEIYAGMVSNLDYNVGLLIQHLKDIGEYDDTFIMFQSDNGAEGWPIDSGADPKATDESYAAAGVFETLGSDNGLQNARRLQYGLRWAEVSATPLAQEKGSLGEGGVSVPAFVHLPGQTESLAPFRSFTHVTDNPATFLALAGVAPPSTPAPADVDAGTGIDKNKGKVTYKGRNVYPITGISLLPALNGSTAAIHTTPFGDESYGRAYVYSADGAWKARWTEPPFGPLDGHWELFSILQDRGETNDVSAQNPDILTTLLGQWQGYMTSVGGVEPLQPRGYY